jgi:hypothetical protein
MNEVTSSLIRDNITEYSDPYMAYATVGYKEGKREKKLKGWEKVTKETEKKEPDTLGIISSKPSKMRTC